MWKLIIADDEPKIRRGLKKILDWNSYDIEIAGEAEDGELALELIKKEMPDIILLDINMPFLNGLNLLEKLNEINNKSIVIIISGYDDFSYAQQAVKLNVFDYVLKPVTKENMKEIICKAIEKLKNEKEDNQYLKWIEKQLKDNIDDLKQNFFMKWLDNEVSDDEVLKQLKYFNISFENDIGIIMVRLVEKLNVEVIDKRWNSDLLNYAICNLLSEKFKDIETKFIFKDSKSNIVLVAKISHIKEWIQIGSELESEISKYLKCNVTVEQANVSNGILEVKKVYYEMVEKLKDKKRFSPIILHAINYIEKNYYVNDLNITNISNKLDISSSYLSKMLKKETGLSFIDYLTNIRIKKAMYIMEDPTIKIYDVAELVGYNNQHYFCRAFKKFTGVSPTEYKRGK